jgi:hypothetical protein
LRAVVSRAAPTAEIAMWDALLRNELVLAGAGPAASAAAGAAAPYAAALSEAEALAELLHHSGTQFSPVVVDAFLRGVAQEQVAAGLVQR